MPADSIPLFPIDRGSSADFATTMHSLQSIDQAMLITNLRFKIVSLYSNLEQNL